MRLVTRGRCLLATPIHSVRRDRKSTRLNSSHQIISYAVFCLKKKKRIGDATSCACTEVYHGMPAFHPPQTPPQAHKLAWSVFGAQHRLSVSASSAVDSILLVS